MLVDKLLMTTSIQFMGTKHSRADKDSPRISSYNWQPEEFSLIRLFIVFTITLSLNLPQILFINAFALSLIPSLPMPLVQKPAKSKPLAQDWRSITLVRSQALPRISNTCLWWCCIRRASGTHCINSHVNKRFHCKDLHKKLIRTTM